MLSIESFGIGYRLRTSGRISKHYKASESRSRMCLNPKLTSRLAFNAALAYIIRLRTKLILAGLRSVCDVFGITGLATTVDRSGRSASGIPKLTSRLAFNAALAYIIRLRTKLILAGLRSVCDVFGITGLATTVDRSGRSASGIPILVSKDDAKTMVVKTHHSID